MKKNTNPKKLSKDSFIPYILIKMNIFLLIIFSVKSNSFNQRPDIVDPLKSGVIFLSPENIDFEILRYNYGFVMFISNECKHSQAIEPMFHETSNTLKMILNEENKNKEENYKILKDVKENLKKLGFFIIDGLKYPELMKRYSVEKTPYFIWFNKEKDHYRIYNGETELPKYFLEFAINQVEYKIKEITFEDLLNLSKENELKGKNLLLFVGDETEKNSFYYNNLMQTAFNNDITNLYKTNDPNIKEYFQISLENNKHKFNAIMFKISNNKLEINKHEKLNLNNYDFLQLDFLENNSTYINKIENYSKNFNLSKAFPITNINNLITLFSHYPVTKFSQLKEKLITRGLPTIVLVHDFEINQKEYRDMLNIYTEISKKYRKELFFMIATKYSKITKILAESFSLKKENFPTLCLTSLSSTNKEKKKIDKFRLVTKNKYDILTKEKITKFIEDWKSIKIPPYVPSEDIPKQEKDEDNIYKIVADNFHSFIKKNRKFILINICSNRLEICEKFRDRLIRVSHKLIKIDNIIVAEYNPYLNDIEDLFDARYIPSLILIPEKGNRLKGIRKYDGKLNTKDIVKWIIEETNTEINKEILLPMEESLLMEEDFVDMRAIDLENKRLSRSIYNKLIDPIQKELWNIPTNEDIELEDKFYQEFYHNFFNPVINIYYSKSNDL